MWTVYQAPAPVHTIMYRRRSTPMHICKCVWSKGCPRAHEHLHIHPPTHTHTITHTLMCVQTHRHTHTHTEVALLWYGQTGDLGWCNIVLPLKSRVHCKVTFQHQHTVPLTCVEGEREGRRRGRGGKMEGKREREREREERKWKGRWIRKGWRVKGRGDECTQMYEFHHTLTRHSINHTLYCGNFVEMTQVSEHYISVPQLKKEREDLCKLQIGLDWNHIQCGEAFS